MTRTIRRARFESQFRPYVVERQPYVGQQRHWWTGTEWAHAVYVLLLLAMLVLAVVCAGGSFVLGAQS